MARDSGQSWESDTEPSHARSKEILRTYQASTPTEIRNQVLIHKQVGPHAKKGITPEPSSRCNSSSRLMALTGRHWEVPPEVRACLVLRQPLHRISHFDGLRHPHVLLLHHQFHHRRQLHFQMTRRHHRTIRCYHILLRRLPTPISPARTPDVLPASNDLPPSPADTSPTRHLHHWPPRLAALLVPVDYRRGIITTLWVILLSKLVHS